MIKLGVSVQGAQTAYVGTASGDRQAKAALMIQCAARGYLSRQELDRLAENRKVEEEKQKQELLDSLQIYRTFQSSVAPALASEVRLRRHSSLHQISAAAAGGGDAEQEEEEGESDDDDNGEYELEEDEEDAMQDEDVDEQSSLQVELSKTRNRTVLEPPDSLVLPSRLELSFEGKGTTSARQNVVSSWMDTKMDRSDMERLLVDVMKKENVHEKVPVSNPQQDATNAVCGVLTRLQPSKSKKKRRR